MEKKYHLCTSREGKEYFSLPAQWQAVDFAAAGLEGSLLPVEQMTREALLKPVGGLPLAELVTAGKTVAIIIDDCTRPTPTSAILSVLLPFLAEQGHPPEKVTIVVALGTHAPVPANDLIAKVGEKVAASYRIVQHNAWGDDLVSISVPGEEKEVRINPHVAGADIKIGISSILPHPMAGYGGGPKIIMPGVSNFAYIRPHHMKNTIDPASTAGRTEGNPFHQACMRVARAVGLDFSINCVYNRFGDVIRVIGGSLDAAFSKAVEVCFKELGVRFEEKVDITITSTYPHTHAHQFPKGLAAPDKITKESGAILLSVPTVHPLPDEFLASFDIIRERSHDKPAAYVREAMGQSLPFLPDKPLEFNMAMKCVIIRPKIRTILVSSMISESHAGTMGFEHAPTVEAGIKLLQKDYSRAKVAIFPSGGLIVPVID
ncbi:MAG TPA: lactate racemase domain-containing protein [Syntrophorhabdaceae bacterium]|jgi:nickel-dependent lactate racemase